MKHVLAVCCTFYCTKVPLDLLEGISRVCMCVCLRVRCIYAYSDSRRQNFSIALLFNPNHKRLHSVSRHLKHSHNSSSSSKTELFYFNPENFWRVVDFTKRRIKQTMKLSLVHLNHKIEIKKICCFSILFDLSILFNFKYTTTFLQRTTL